MFNHKIWLHYLLRTMSRKCSRASPHFSNLLSIMTLCILSHDRERSRILLHPDSHNRTVQVAINLHAVESGIWVAGPSLSNNQPAGEVESSATLVPARPADAEGAELTIVLSTPTVAQVAKPLLKDFVRRLTSLWHRSTIRAEWEEILCKDAMRLLCSRKLAQRVVGSSNHPIAKAGWSEYIVHDQVK